jgi:hypothetical protein
LIHSHKEVYNKSSKSVLEWRILDCKISLVWFKLSQSFSQKKKTLSKSHILYKEQALSVAVP